MGPELEMEIPAWASNFTSQMRSSFISGGYRVLVTLETEVYMTMAVLRPLCWELGPVGLIMFVKPFEVFR